VLLLGLVELRRRWALNAREKVDTPGSSIRG